MTVRNLVRHAALIALPVAVIAWIPAPVYGGTETPDVKPASPARLHWTAAHQAFAGPLLDAKWFSKRRVVVYLMPEQGDFPAMRDAAALVMRDRWLEGDWSLKHVIVSDVGRVRFAARQRIAVREIAEQMTKEAGQKPDFIADNEDYVRKNVFFLHDPERTVWRELLGDRASGREAAVVMLDYGGSVVRVLDVEEALRPVEAAANGPDQLAEPTVVLEVRKDLPFRPDLGG